MVSENTQSIILKTEKTMNKSLLTQNAQRNVSL